MGRVLENIVYNQLKYDEYDVMVGHLRGGEVDLPLREPRERYTSRSLRTCATRKPCAASLAPLRKIGDEYRKMVVVQDGTYPGQISTESN